MQAYSKGLGSGQEWPSNPEAHRIQVNDQHFTCIILFNIKTILWSFYHPNIANETTEVQLSSRKLSNLPLTT